MIIHYLNKQSNICIVIVQAWNRMQLMINVITVACVRIFEDKALFFL